MAVIVLSVRHVPESRDPDAGGTTDYPGAAAMVVFSSGVTFAFVEAPALGWSLPAVLAMALAGVTGLAVFPDLGSPKADATTPPPPKPSASAASTRPDRQRRCSGSGSAPGFGRIGA